MAYEMKDGQISIFRNEEAEGDQPTFTGKAMIDGTFYKVSLWGKKSKAGKKYLNGNIQIPVKQSSNPVKPDDDFF